MDDGLGKSMDRLIGKKLGDFTIIERIGQGGSAAVYRAEQPSVKRDVALKVIDVIAASEHGDFYKRFEREAALIASLEHTNILTVHDYGIQGNWAYMAMRYMRGGTLKDLMKENRLPLDRILDIFVQIASGLAHAHSKGIIHRDLKPANILLDEAGNAYLTDFGLAKIVKGDEDSTQSGQIVGTITNMAPEQLRGESLDHRADIYGLGTILYEMATGETPFAVDKSKDIVSLIYHHLETDPTPPSTHDASIVPELEATIMKAIAKRPDQRFNTIAEMVESLTPLRAKLSTSAGSLPAVDGSLVEIAEHTNSLIREKTKSSRLNLDPIWVTVVAAVIVIALFAGVVVLNDVMTTADDESSRLTHTVLTGVSATSSEIMPTTTQIEAAQNNLNDDGFVGIIACTLETEYHATLSREMRTFLLDAGIDNKVYDSDGEAYDQIPILEQAMAEGAQGIILCPLNYDLLDAPLQTIEDKQLPLVLIAREENLYGGVQLSSDDDNYNMGYTVGQYAGQLVQDEMNGTGQVIILDFPEMDVIVERANGLEEGILSVASDVEIVGRYLGGIPDNGQESVENLLEDNIEFNMILSINDAGAYGAIEALEDADLTPDDVMIVSIDAERQAVDYMREGRFIRGSLSVGREEMAQTATNTIIQMLAGADVPESILVESGDVVTPEPE